MKPTTDSSETSPPKQFAVWMITRDISLGGLLGVLDNCLDSAMRVADGDSVDYAKNFVKIKLATGEFSIQDNRGGIFRQAAINHAFKMGRAPDDECDSGSETARHEVSCQVSELIRHSCGEGPAAAAMARSNASKVYAEP